MYVLNRGLFTCTTTKNSVQPSHNCIMVTSERDTHQLGVLATCCTGDRSPRITLFDAKTCTNLSINFSPNQGLVLSHSHELNDLVQDGSGESLLQHDSFQLHFCNNKPVIIHKSHPHTKATCGITPLPEAGRLSDRFLAESSASRTASTQCAEAGERNDQKSPDQEHKVVNVGSVQWEVRSSAPGSRSCSGPYSRVSNSCEIAIPGNSDCN